MRKGLLLLLLVLALPSFAEARSVRQPSRWGLGFMAGGPTGLTVKHWLGGSDAFDLAIGGGPGLRVHGDYLFGLAQLSSSRDLAVDLYLGPGAILGFDRYRYCGWRWQRDRFCGDDDPYIGGRVAFGVDFVFRRAPVSFGLELAPGILIDPDDAGTIVDAFLYMRFLL